MIELLQTEVDVVPGRKPNHEVSRTSNSIVVRVSNETDLENLITLVIACDEPFWRNSWVKLEASSAPNNAGDQRVKEPDYNADNTAVRLYVPRNSTWDVRVKFEVPLSSLARAGSYVFKLTGQAQHGLEQGITPSPEEKQGLMVLRPYYDWEIAVDPQEKFVKIWPWRRKGEFQLKVRNKGNDWLYCELAPPTANKDLAIELPTQIVAVPPSDIEKEPSVRSVPMVARTGVKRVRGERQPLPIQVSVTRQDAPTVPPLDDAAQMGGSSLNLDSAVTVKSTSESRQTSQSALIFCPPIPSTVQGCLGSVVANAKGLVMSMIGLFMAVQIASVMLMQYEQNSLSGQVISNKKLSPKNDVFTVQGKFIQGTSITVKRIKGDAQDIQLEDAKAKSEKGTNDKTGSDKFQGTLQVGRDTLDRRSFTFQDKALLTKNGEYEVLGQRGRWFAPIANLLMQPKHFDFLTVGAGGAEFKASLTQTDGAAGQTIDIHIVGPELSDSPQFKVGNTQVTLSKSKSDPLTWQFKVPGLPKTPNGYGVILTVAGTDVPIAEKFHILDITDKVVGESPESRELSPKVLLPGNSAAETRITVLAAKGDLLAMAQKVYSDAFNNKDVTKDAERVYSLATRKGDQAKGAAALSLAVVGLLSGNLDKVEKALGMDPQQPLIYNCKAKILIDKRMTLDAAECLEHAILLNSKAIQLRLLAGVVRYQYAKETKSPFTKAQEHLREAEHREPGAIHKYLPELEGELKQIIQ